MTRLVLLVIGYVLMLAGPLLQGLSGSANPNAYIFAPILLAGSIPLVAGRNIQPSARIMAQGILICGAVVLGLWYLGGLAAPMAIAPAAPVGAAIAGALIAAAANLLKFRRA
ncbi:hypothetical protein [Paracoccus sp. PAR01]|uniref:hypothetical protein n=1 Tax=Paracoccus sp. PAR01 TaxID=2769282 RepID=UPI00177BC83E|nr:hypothetical protein [Paracoccus sp. PAR01]MBD9526916.1 hypothetical protein [Paracoccus sp. PAR01]